MRLVFITSRDYTETPADIAEMIRDQKSLGGGFKAYSEGISDLHRDLAERKRLMDSFGLGGRGGPSFTGNTSRNDLTTTHDLAGIESDYLPFDVAENNYILDYLVKGLLYIAFVISPFITSFIAIHYLSIAFLAVLLFILFLLEIYLHSSKKGGKKVIKVIKIKRVKHG